MIFVIGWIGAICFAFYAVPQVVKTFRTRSTKDLSAWSLGMCIAGEIFCSIYIYNTTGLRQIPLLANYTVNGILLTYLLYMKAKYK